MKHGDDIEHTELEALRIRLTNIKRRENESLNAQRLALGTNEPDLTRLESKLLDVDTLGWEVKQQGIHLTAEDCTQPYDKPARWTPASCLSHYTILGEIPKKNSGQSEVVKGSTKDSEISGQNTKEMAIISDINFFWP